MSQVAQPLIGQPLQRVDAHLKVTGQAKYSGDWRDTKFFHCVIVNSTIASGKILRFDLDLAKSVPGVIEILTHETIGKFRTPPSAGPKTSTGDGFLPLQSPIIYFNDQPVALVIATTLEAATQGAKWVSVHYARTALKSDYLKEKAVTVKKNANGGEIASKRGDFKKAFAASDVQVRATYTSPFLHHSPMEPSVRAIIPEGDKFLIYDATQAVFAAAKSTAELLQKPLSDVRVITKFIGGSFGGKGAFWTHQAILAMAASRLKKPLKLTLTRQQMFTAIGHRAQTKQVLALGASRDGRLVAISHDTLSSTSVNKDFPEVCGEATAMLYQCENVDVSYKIARVNYQANTYTRAPGLSVGSFALESAIDELAEKLKLDPLEIRRKNHSVRDDGENKPFSSKSLLECYAKGAAAFGWEKRKPEPKSRLDGEWYVGSGVATATYPANLFATKVRITIGQDGQAMIVTASQDVGTGTTTIAPQIAADALGMPIASIKFDLGDSRYPMASASGGSSTLTSVGSVIKMAAEKLQAELREMAVRDEELGFFGLDASAIRFHDGELQAGSVRVKIAELLASNDRTEISAEAEVGASRAGNKTYSGHAFGAHFVEVRVHRRTGEVRVSKMVGAFAAGKIVNPRTAKNQFEGGMIWGLGLALMEKTEVDLRTARFVTRDFADYHIPTQSDVPDLEVIMIDEKEEHLNPIGVKGLGEIGIVGVGAAVANAVYNACGVRVRDLPMTPDKIVT